MNKYIVQYFLLYNRFLASGQIPFKYFYFSSLICSDVHFNLYELTYFIIGKISKYCTYSCIVLFEPFSSTTSHSLLGCQLGSLVLLRLTSFRIVESLTDPFIWA